jgi:serine/threonine protein phosphatase PrpC
LINELRNLYAVGGAVAGPSHSNVGAECEDSFIYDFSIDREWFYGIVSDGCGSASRAKEGSEFITQKLITPLGELAKEISKRGPGDWLIDEVVLIIANLRKTMRSEFSGKLLDYSATVVAVVCSREGGFFIHLGDGIGLALNLSDDAGEGSLEEIARTNPENGEYVNQTFYLTEQNWLHHLRVTPFGKWDLLMLCTDGAQDILFNGTVAEAASIESLIGSLNFSESDDEEKIENFLNHPLAQSKSGDDKTCLIVALESTQLHKINSWKLVQPQIKSKNDTAHLYQNPRAYNQENTSAPEENIYRNDKEFKKFDIFQFLVNRSNVCFKALFIFLPILIVLLVGVIGWHFLQGKEPEPPETKSSPAPPETVSSPAPPETVSSPAPPKTKSSPAPPETVSSPAPPETVSSPAPPKTKSSPAPPETESLPVLPETKSSPERTQLFNPESNNGK